MDTKDTAITNTILALAAELSAPSDASETVPLSCVGLREQVSGVLHHLRSAMYPNIFGAGASQSDAITTAADLRAGCDLLTQALCQVVHSGQEEAMAMELLRELPSIREVLDTDVRAGYEGDPAAQSPEEVMLAYPAFEAISIYRIAHKLYAMGVPILPRMMTELAHQSTGIDIHPGATIGRYFFMDHGTGVVIGETTTVGHHVKLYQGVTLGAKSFEVAADGSLVKGIKRHPDIGDYVVIYSGATILGGQTVIGDHCVIGGNVWLTHSVEAGKTVLATSKTETQAHI